VEFRIDEDNVLWQDTRLVVPNDASLRESLLTEAHSYPFSVGERVIEGPEMIEVTNAKVAVAKEKLKKARTRQKSYADKHRGALEFQPALPPQLSHVHDVFHVSLLRGYKYQPLHVITYPLDQIQTDLSYVEEPEAIIDRQDRIMRKKTIPFVKILWRNHPEREATWETEESIRTSYPHFLP
nr:hypothetical protein [Tanacetum cinerariifolium]